MSPIEFAAWFLPGMFAFWLLGGFVARISGLLLVLVGVANLALDPRVGAALLIVIGAATWLAGHWHYALRHHAYKSPLARYVFCRWAPPWLDPTRNWAVPVVDPEPTGSKRRQT
jgi:hypothetical protein